MLSKKNLIVVWVVTFIVLCGVFLGCWFVIPTMAENDRSRMKSEMSIKLSSAEMICSDIVEESEFVKIGEDFTTSRKYYIEPTAEDGDIGSYYTDKPFDVGDTFMVYEIVVQYPQHVSENCYFTTRSTKYYNENEMEQAISDKINKAETDIDTEVNAVADGRNIILISITVVIFLIFFVFVVTNNRESAERKAKIEVIDELISKGKEIENNTKSYKAWTLEGSVE